MTMNRGLESDQGAMSNAIGDTSMNDKNGASNVDEGNARDVDRLASLAQLPVGSPSRMEASNKSIESGSPARSWSQLSEERKQTSSLADSHAFSNLDDVDLPTYVRDHNQTLTFPEKLMLMLMHADRLAATSGKRPEELPVSWVNNGSAFVIRNKTELVSGWLPLFFRQAKFSSFTRKLYRWGFRQVNHAAAEPPETQAPQRSSMMYFGNENFQRDNKARLSNMRSVTAAGRRREQAEQAPAGGAAESKEQDIYRMSLEPRGILQQEQQHLAQPANPFLANNASLLQLRNTQAALASLGGMEQQSHPILQQHSSQLIQQAVARAHLQQQQQLAAQRLVTMQGQDSMISGNQYVLQLSQLLNQQPQALSAALSRQLLSLQQAQASQQLPTMQPPVLPQDTDQQRQERLRSIYGMLLQQVPHQSQGDMPSSFLPPPRPPNE